MKALLINFFLVLGVIFQSSANTELSGLLSSMEKDAFTMQVYQRQGKMVAIHLKNKTASEKITIQIIDSKGHSLYQEKVDGSQVYVKKFDLSEIKSKSFKVAINYAGEDYETDVAIKEVASSIEVYQRPNNIIAVQTGRSYGKRVSIYISDAVTGEEITRKQLVSPGKSVSKFDFSQAVVDKINVKVVVGKELINKEITLL